MHLPDSKKTTLAGVLIFGLFGLLIGILLIALNADFLLNVVFVVMGVITILYNIPGIALGLTGIRTRFGVVSLIFSLVSVAIGLLMIFWNTGVLMVVLGVYMIVFPLVQILLAKEKLLQLKVELPKLIVGVVLLLIGPARAIGTVLDLAGWIVLVLTAVYVIIVLVGQSRVDRHVDKTGTRVFVDTTGDGKIDAVYVDTTGDGKVDSSTPYREEKE
ncbi:MAG: hypothetical protein IJF33_03215 [Clostridia bacterium]|nr:hypothetical protein [Clostridia bacterium]